MIATGCQRWRDHRASYRPAGEPIRVADYEVERLEADAVAKAFVSEHHYSGSYPAARWRFALRRRGELVGVAVFSQPMLERVLELAPGPRCTELGRLVLLDDVPANGESWFVARAFELLRGDGVTGVISFSDPTHGHVGTVYQALNGTYLGRANPKTIRVFPDGSVMSARAISKIRAKEKGWRYASELLRAGGAPAPGADLRSWLTEWLPRVTRTVRHPGNHKYAWAIDKRLKRALPVSLPYPKLDPLFHVAERDGDGRP